MPQIQDRLQFTGLSVFKQTQFRLTPFNSQFRSLNSAFECQNLKSGQTSLAGLETTIPKSSRLAPCKGVQTIKFPEFPEYWGRLNQQIQLATLKNQIVLKESQGCFEDWRKQALRQQPLALNLFDKGFKNLFSLNNQELTSKNEQLSRVQSEKSQLLRRVESLQSQNVKMSNELSAQRKRVKELSESLRVSGEKSESAMRQYQFLREELEHQALEFKKTLGANYDVKTHFQELLTRKHSEIQDLKRNLRREQDSRQRVLQDKQSLLNENSNLKLQFQSAKRVARERQTDLVQVKKQLQILRNCQTKQRKMQCQSCYSQISALTADCQALRLKLQQVQASAASKQLRLKNQWQAKLSSCEEERRKHYKETGEQFEIRLQQQRVILQSRISQSTAQLNFKQEQRKAMAEQLILARRQINQLSGQLNAKEAQLSILQQRITNLQIQFNEKSLRVQELSKQVGSLDRQRKAQDEKQQEQARSLNQLKSQLKESQSQLCMFREKSLSLFTQLQQVRQSYMSLQTQSKKQKLVYAQQQISIEKQRFESGRATEERLFILCQQTQEQSAIILKLKGIIEEHIRINRKNSAELKELQTYCGKLKESNSLLIQQNKKWSEFHQVLRRAELTEEGSADSIFQNLISLVSERSSVFSTKVEQEIRKIYSVQVLKQQKSEI